jgi:methionine synthase II (cobalamin-independent)
MFATLLGGLPAPVLPDGRPTGRQAEVEAAIRAQEEAGLEPITDGRRSDPTSPAVDRWRFAAGLTDRAVKQALRGPYAVAEGDGTTSRAARRGVVERLRGEVEALVAAGCPLIEIEESGAHRIGADPAARELFRDLHAALAEGLEGVHLSLSIVGGSADGAGAETILAPGYASFAFDLIAGPDNWRLAALVPGDRGLVAGALSGRERGDEPKEILLWAAHYAASTGSRGILRVGLGSAGGYESLPWDVALRKLKRLGEAARLAAMPPGPELSRRLDPRAVSIRTAALGHDAPPPPKRSRRRPA